MFINFKPYLTITSLAIMLIACAKDAVASPDVSFNGFANIGLTYSDNNEVLFRNSILNEGRDGLSFYPDTWIGLQASIDISDRWDAVGQVVLQDRDDDNLSNYLELFFLRYKFNRNVFVKLGRFSSNSYLFTDSRYISQSYNWVRAPIDQYSAVGAVGNMNGLQLGFLHDFYNGLLKGTVAYGTNEFNNDRTSAFTFDYEDLISLNLEYSSLDWRIQVSHLRSTIQNLNFSQVDAIKNLDQAFPSVFLPYIEELQDSILADGKEVSYSSIGFQYTKNNYELIAEYGLYDSTWALADRSSFSYVSIAKTFDIFTAFAVIGETDRKQGPEVIDYRSAEAELPAPLYAALVENTSQLNGLARDNNFDQQSISVGVRWDVAVSWSVKTQFDHFRMNPFGSGFFTLPSGGVAPSDVELMNVFNVSVSTTF